MTTRLTYSDWSEILQWSEDPIALKRIVERVLSDYVVLSAKDALQRAATAAREMHDPIAPDCAEWANWLDTRAQNINQEQNGVSIGNCEICPRTNVEVEHLSDSVWACYDADACFAAFKKDRAGEWENKS